MKILISQTDLSNTMHPHSNFQFDALERAWYTFLSGHQLIPVPNFGYIDESVEFDCLVLTGGPDTYNRHFTEDKLFYHAKKLNKPIIGVCHGAFAVNDLTGGVNGRIDHHHGTDHTIIMDGNHYTVNSYHSQTISSLGPAMISIAVDSDNNIEAFKHVSKQIYGIVWHPERMLEPVLPAEVELLIKGNK